MSLPLQPWTIAAEDFPGGGYASDQLEFLLGYAVLAPSTHNTQPWLFRINAMDVDVFGDSRRSLPVIDPSGRELVISCGAALFNLRVAAEYFEKAWRLEVLPEEGHPRWLARFYLGLQRETSSEDVVLFHSIARRRTDRALFRPECPDAATLERLEVAAVAEGAWLRVFTDEDDRNALADLVAEGDRHQWADHGFRQELSHWVRPEGDGAVDGIPMVLPGRAAWLSFAGPSVVRTFDLGKGMAAQDREIAAHSPVLAVLGTEADDPVSWLAAGQALESVLLRAESEGVAASFLGQAVEVPHVREALAARCGGGSPQVLLRLGRGEGRPGPAPRRSVREVLLQQEVRMV